MVSYLLNGLACFLPTLVFLTALVLLDSFKLVRLRLVLGAVGWGCLAGLAGMVINHWLLDVLPLDTQYFSRYLAPPLEETLKAGLLIYLISRRKVGFLVDGAILGFASGAGFAIVENIHFWLYLPQANLFIWIVRGFGTAVMHGGATALFGILVQGWVERHDRIGTPVFLWGLLASAAVHSVFNHFFISPVASTMGLVVGLPLLLVLIYRRSEEALRKWLGVGFDSDVELMHMFESGTVSESRIGKYLKSLRDHFSPAEVADMMCLLRLHVELSLQAKALLIAHEAGVAMSPKPETKAQFTELRHLEKHIGPAGRLAMQPVFKWNSKDLWQLHFLEK